MTDISNLNKTADPFSEDTAGIAKSDESYVHIRLQQRNGRKTLTTVQGIDAKFDLKKITKHFKKKFACNGTVVEHPEYGEVVQLQGDQRNLVSKDLVDMGISNKDYVKVHGF